MAMPPLRRAPLLGALVLLLGTPAVALAAPIDDDIELLRTRPTGMEEADWRAKRRDVARKLGDARSSRAVDALIEVVETERYDALLTISIDALGKQGDGRAIGPLQKILRDRSYDAFVRESAADAIRELGGTPDDGSRPAAGGATVGGESDVLSGPQLGTMGEASVEPEPLEDVGRDKPMPDNVRARARSFGFALGQLDFDLDTRIDQQPLLADGGLGAFARYVDERQRWGFSVDGRLDGRIANGDLTSAPSGAGGDDGDVLLITERLAGDAEAHVYFGKTDVHAFGALGFEQRLTRIGVESLDGGNQSSLSQTRLTMDAIPAAGLGWGRHLDAGSDLLVDAVLAALSTENILAKPLDEASRRKIRDAVYRRSNAWSSYPRLAAVLAVLSEGGHLARRPSPRLVHRLRSILEDPSFLDRKRGIVVRAGFLYGAPILQRDLQGRGDGVGAPFVQWLAGFPIHRERQIDADTRFWYDAVGETGYTVDAGALYTRFLHTKLDDYRGQWFAGLRGGVSHRTLDVPDDVDPRLGYRAIGQAGYAYGFNRGSEIRVTGRAGVDSGGFVAGAGLALTFGLVRASVIHPGPAAGGSPPAPTSPEAK
jgi:hypothetical protein